MKYLLFSVLTAIGAVVLYFAVIGAVFMFETSRTQVSTEHCPKVVHYEDDTYACIVRMDTVDDNVKIVREVE